MINKKEKKIIIKNAFEFLKREDLVSRNNCIKLPFLPTNRPKDYTVKNMMIWTKLDNSKNLHIEYYIDFSCKLLSIPLNYDIELVNLFNETLSKLKEQNKSFLEELGKKINCNCKDEPVSSKCAEPDEFSFDKLKKKMVEENWSFDKPPILPEGFFSPENYSDNDEHRNEEMLKACQQGLDLLDEMVEQSNTKQDADINIQNNSKYRRKSDGKIFFLISQHELKTTMNGITSSKEICEIVVDITKIYVLFSPALEGRYNHDILYVKENELNEDYERLSED